MGGLEGILKKIKPDAESERKERRFALGALEKLQQQLKPAKVVLAGSFAKGTFLEGDKDIDIFVLFSHHVEKEAMEGILRAGVENAFPGAFLQIAYAQHPYVRVFVEGRKIDVVPAYEIGHGSHFVLKSAVDRSQLHTEYIMRNMNSAQKDEVRLLKKLLKANGLYGAEIRVQGLSGYVCELLILAYCSFDEALRAIATKWDERTFIDIRHGASPQQSLAKFEGPLVFLDPVDENRNVAAALSPENYSNLILLARAFLASKNRISFFSPSRLTPNHCSSLKKRHIYCLEFSAPNVVDDVLWGQVRKFYSQLSGEMKKHGFEIIRHAMDGDKGRVLIMVELFQPNLPKTRLVLGPPLRFAEDCANFASEYQGAFAYQGRLAAIATRQVRTMEQLFQTIRKMNVPSHLGSVRHAKLYKGAKAIAKCRAIIEARARILL